MAASQLLPSCNSPSPVRTKVRHDAPSNLAASAVPTATGKPCPNGPVFVSTPGTLVQLGWPLRRESGCAKVSSSSGEKKPASARVVYNAPDRDRFILSK